MVVVYYTCPYYLDTAIEAIKSISSAVELRVIIEVTPACQSSTLIDIESLDNLKVIEPGERVLGKEKWEQFRPYFKNAASVEFFIQKHPKSFSIDSLKKTLWLGRYLKKYKADVIHFDTLTTRCIWLYPYIRSKKLFITVHDPLPHSGEYSWKEKLPNWTFLSWADGYFFYSAFALKQFAGYYKSVKAKKDVIRFQPVTFFSKFMSNEKKPPDSILFLEDYPFIKE